MRLSRFFVNTPLHLGEHEVPAYLAHYMGRVLRLSVNDPVQLFDGSGLEFLGTISQITKKSLMVNLTKQLTGLGESPLYTHLGQGLARGEKMDFVIQKATELGVSEITPLFTGRSEVRLTEERTDKRIAHWQQVAISACEQSGRSKIPIIHPPQSVSEWAATVQADLKLMLHLIAEPMGTYQKPASLALLIGPEGGFTDEEIALAQQHEFQQVHLGSRVLRTETAPIVALSIAQQLWGDFNPNN